MQSSIKANLKQNIVLVLKPATPSSFSRYPSTVKAVYTPLDSYHIIELRRKGKGGGGGNLTPFQYTDPGCYCCIHFQDWIDLKVAQRLGIYFNNINSLIIFCSPRHVDFITRKNLFLAFFVKK